MNIDELVMMHLTRTLNYVIKMPKEHRYTGIAVAWLTYVNHIMLRRDILEADLNKVSTLSSDLWEDVLEPLNNSRDLGWVTGLVDDLLKHLGLQEQHVKFYSDFGKWLYERAMSQDVGLMSFPEFHPESMLSSAAASIRLRELETLSRSPIPHIMRMTCDPQLQVMDRLLHACGHAVPPQLHHDSFSGILHDLFTEKDRLDGLAVAKEVNTLDALLEDFIHEIKSSNFLLGGSSFKILLNFQTGKETALKAKVDQLTLSKTWIDKGMMGEVISAIALEKFAVYMISNLTLLEISYDASDIASSYSKVEIKTDGKLYPFKNGE